MNRDRVQALATTLVVSAGLSILTQVVLTTLLQGDAAKALAGAAFVAGWWANLAVAAVMSIRAARKAASAFTDPRYGRILGGVMGLWAGIGALAGEAIAAGVLVSQTRADVRAGLVLFFGAVSLIVSVFAGAIAGREAAHEPADETADEA